MDSLRHELPAGTTLQQWDDAYIRVEAAFAAFHIRNKLLLTSLVRRVLARTEERVRQNPALDPATVSAEEVDVIILSWFREVLDLPDIDEESLSQKGRLALLLAEMPKNWQGEFLEKGPWPEEFVKKLREAYLATNPDFQHERMVPRPIELGQITSVAESALRGLDKLPLFRTILLWGTVIGLFAALFWYTR